MIIHTYSLCNGCTGKRGWVKEELENISSSDSKK